MIISREKEQKKLRDLYESGRAEFVAVYGRRGVGKTLGCGTGAIATASVAMKKLYTDSEIIVELDGGNVEVKEENGEYFLIGDAEMVFEGSLKNL